MKYSKEFKLECIRKYKNGEYIEDPPSTKHDTFHQQIRKWVRIYDSLGEFGLDHNRPTLDIDQKLELIRRIKNGESYKTAAYSVGIEHSLLIKWHRIYLESGIDGLKSLKRGRASMNKKKPKKDKDKSELELLKEENEYLKAENEYLKKLDALVSKRKTQPQKKK